MRLRPLVFALFAASAVSPNAWAQLTTQDGIPIETLSVGLGRYVTTQGLASGLKLGDSAMMHAAIYSDVGYDTNVLYTPSAESKPAAVLHVSPRIEINNAERDGSRPAGAYYQIFAGLDWRKYLSGTKEITEQDAINPALGASAELSANQSLSLLLSDTFLRYQQAPFSVSNAGNPITRDSNLAAVGLRFAPGGGRLRFVLRYENLIDAYEGDYSNASNMDNQIMLDVGWRWLPKTSIYLRVSQDVVTYFHGTSDLTSYPLRTLVGLRGLLTAKLSLNVAAGYNNAFYTGDNPSGLGNVGIVTEVSYAIDALSRMGIGYHHDFTNSPFVGRWYNMDAIYGVFQQMVASRVLTYLYGRYENRRFGGGVFGAGEHRTDNYLMGGVAVDYMIRNFFVVGASYAIDLNRTNESSGAAGGVEYTKQTVLFRLGLTY